MNIIKENKSINIINKENNDINSNDFENDSFIENYEYYKDILSDTKNENIESLKNIFYV